MQHLLDNEDRPKQNFLPDPEERQRLKQLLSGPLPEIPPIYFYDDNGSGLFEQITYLPEYYQTRAEIAILEWYAPAILQQAAPKSLVELGSGAGRKIRLLLNAWQGGEQCTMLDVNERFLSDSVDSLTQAYPAIRFNGIQGDFTKDIARLGAGGHRMIVFFGGTLGNLYPHEQHAFFESLYAQMEENDSVLIGVDLVKDHARLEAAYNDSQGITAAFNRGALYTLNQRFGANFEPTAFQHRAFYDPINAWIEMRLVAQEKMSVQLPALQMSLDLEVGSEIRTEISCKFTRTSLEASAKNLAITGWFEHPEGLFALALMQKKSLS